MKHIVLWMLIGLFILWRWLLAVAQARGRVLPHDVALVMVDASRWALSGWVLGELLYDRQSESFTVVEDAQSAEERT